MTILATRAADGLDRRAFTVTDVERMIEVGVLDRDEKFELIGGEIVPMSPQMMPHVMVKSRMARWFFDHAPASLEVVIGASVVVRASGLFEPDIVLFFSGPTGKGYLGVAEAQMIVEIADTSLTRDLRKAKDYAAARIPELWIVDLQAAQTLVFRTIEGVWTEVAPIPFDQPLEALCAPGAGLLIAPLTK